MRSEFSAKMLGLVSASSAASRRITSDLTSAPRLTAMILFISALLSCQSAQAQNVQRNNEAVDLGLRSNLTVNPATLAVELQIPLGNFPGRAGHDVPVTLFYSSKVWNMAYQGFASGPPPGYPGPAPFTILMAKYGDHSLSGWNSSTRSPFVDQSPGYQLYDGFGHARGTGDCSSGCFVIDRVMAWMPDGSAHELRSSDQALVSTQQRPDNLYSVDGTRMRYQRSTDTLFLPDGSRYVMSGSAGYFDRNGNRIHATDTLGRTIPDPLAGVSPSTPVEKSYSLPGVGGNINYVFKWKYLAEVLTTPQTLAYVADSGCPPGTGATYSPHLFTSDISGRVCIQNAMQPFNPVVLSQIVLPTGQSYTFTYTIFGEIDKVMLPTGGYEKFLYGQVSPLSYSSYVYAQYNRGVSRHAVSPTGSSADEVVWLYAGGGGQVNTVRPDQTRTERYAWLDGNSMWGFSADGARAGQAYDERVYSASNQMLRRKLTEWAMTGSNGGGAPGGLQYANRNARIMRETEFIFDTGGGALARTTTYGYDLTYQFDVGIDQTSVSQYDYVLVDQNTAQTIAVTALNSIPIGTLLRTTQITYLTGNANYRTARNIVGLPTSTTIYKGTPTDNNVVARSTISYDEGGPFAQLNDYGSVVNWTDPQTLYRGNPTSTSQWLNYNGSTLATYPSGTYLTTHAQYDQCGSVRRSWDAGDTGFSHPAQIDYSITYNYAYPTSTTSAVPDPSGVYGSTVGLISTTAYDFNTGKVVSTTDANFKTTSYDYTDQLNRLKQVTGPDGAHVNYVYSDTPGDLYLSVLVEEDASRSIETRKYFDGLGRAARSFIYDGAPSTPWLVNDTYFDNVGRVSKVSNPYRVTSPNGVVPPTCSVCTTTSYDALGRVLTVTTPDTAQVATSYGASTSGTLGITMTVTDQALRKRRSLTDALGRMARVDEPNKDTGNLDSGGVSTFYTYNVLGNLLKVTQDSQLRFFMYDSLGRVLRAKNPEQGNFTPDAGVGFPALTDSSSGASNDQWSMGYLYDANGNLSKRRDARNVVTTYAYDALNRNFSTTYSDGITPTLYRYYDSATNGRGRLHWEQALGVSANVFDAYDSRGRPTLYHQKFWVNGTWGLHFNIARTYDRAGHVLTQTHPSGHTVNYGYDIAGRLTNDSGNLGDGVARTYATGITYSEFGGLQQEQFGTQTALYHKQHYNVRGQLYDMRLSTAAWAADEWNWNRGAIVNYNSTADLTCQGQTCRYNSGPDNNGNLRQSQYWIPANEAATIYNWTEDRFAHDYLNRLKSVAEYHGSSASGLSGQDFTQVNNYDRWGNRTLDQALTTPSIPHPNYTADPNTNRLVAPAGFSYSYDNAGNQTSDNYTGQGARTYDAENRMKQAQGIPNNQWQTYTYDADGRRIKRNVNGVETWQIYGLEGELLAEYQSGAAPYLPVTEYGYRSGQLLVTISSGDTQRLSRFIYNLYYGAKQREPSAQELQDGVNQLAAAGVVGQAQLLTSAGQLARSLFTSTNYETSAPARTDSQYVSDLYYAYLQRGPDDSGLGWWTGQAASSRVNVCNGFEASAEFQTRVATLYGTAASDNERTEHLVNNFYLGARGTNATPTELQQQRDALNTAAAQGLSQIQVQAETFGRGLFAGQVNDGSISNTQYVTNLYEGFLQRGPDAGGLGFWSGQASVGTGRQNVLNAFATCPSFRELAGALYREANWLVADHLGTPRMIVNKSGSLASVKRHDYLPFGEEIGGPQVALVGGRTTGQGYVGDSVRQKFTGYEHDGETELEFAHARYYGSSQGRFTSTDPFLGSARIASPQSWNRYAYVLNNPLRLVDPTGMEDQQRQPPPPPPPPPAPLPPIIPPISPDLEGSPDYVAKKELAPQPNVTVTPGAPMPRGNVPLPNGEFATGVVSLFTITVTDEAGRPIPGLDVTESNDTRNDTNGLTTRENPQAVQTDANGSFSDLVTGNANVSNYQLTPTEQTQRVQRQIESSTSVTTIQTLTISAPGYGVLGTAVYDRNFSNMDGQVRRPAVVNGRHVNNFTVSTTPVTMSYP